MGSFITRRRGGSFDRIFFVDLNLPYNVDPEGVYFALIAIGGGLGLIGSYFVEKKHWYDKANGE